MKPIIRCGLLFLLSLACAALPLCGGTAEGLEGYFFMDGAVIQTPEGQAELVIPSALDGKPVTALGDFAIANNDEVTRIVIPEGVTLLGGSAVYACDALTALTLPDSLQVIGRYNVYACDTLEQVTIPAAVQFIGAYSFYSCDALRSVVFLGHAPQLSDGCFEFLADDAVFYVPSDCMTEYAAVLPEGADIRTSGSVAVAADCLAAADDLEFDAATGTVTAYVGSAVAVEIPASIGGVPVTAIGENAFAGEALTPRFMRLPEGLAEIGAHAFDHSGLMAVILPASLETIGDFAFCWAVDCVPVWAAHSAKSIGQSAFEAVKLPSVLTLPDGVETIGARAFANTQLSELYLPASIQTIGAEAFAKSPDMSYLCFAGNSMPQIAADAFDCQGTLEDVDIGWQAGREALSAAEEVFAALGMENCTVWRSNPSDVGAAQSVGRYGVGAAYEQGLLVSCEEAVPDVTVFTIFDGANIIGVGDGCFAGSQTIRSFYPHHAGWFTVIGNRAFADSTLETVELFDSVTAIGAEAFAGSQLRAVTLPETVEHIGGGAFARCKALREVVLTGDAARLPDDCFADCPAVAVYVPQDTPVADGLALAQRLGVTVLRADGAPLVEPCPYAVNDEVDYLADEAFARLDDYRGWAVNLILPAEKNGVALTTLSANVLSRARSTDGFAPAQLPVRSVVVPEGYETLAAGCFADLADVEVIVVYAPVSEIPAGTFSRCPRLRTVVFVNGTQRVCSYAFEDCPSLETVYIGGAKICDNAFSGCGVTADTLTQTLPDVDPLLDAVKSDAIIPPEPEDEPQMPEAESITDPNADAYLGVWLLDTMEEAGETFAAADYGLEMHLIFTDDGLAALDEGGESDVTVWRMENGEAFLCVDGETFIQILRNADGSLSFGDEETTMTFVRADAAQAARPEGAALAAGDDGFAGEWLCIWMATGGSVGSDPRTAYGAHWTLTLNTDGTGAMDIGGAEPGVWGVDEDGITRYNDMPITLRADGRLQYGSAMSGGMIFSRSLDDAWDAQTDAFANPGESAAAQTSQQGAVQRSETGASAAAPADMAERVGRKYICKTVTTGGVTLDAAMIGGEYAITFAENGDALYKMAGYEVPGLRWTADDAAFCVTYFDGTEFAFVPTAEGFDMDFYGSMLMHFVPEE